MRDAELDPRVGAALGGLSAVVLAAALVPLRDELAGEALALLLVLPVLLGAVTGGRIGGAVSAVCATIGFDFFLTQPYLSMTINSADDVETAVSLLIVALVVGTVAAGGQRAATKAQAGHAELESIHRVAEVVANDAPRRVVIDSARRELRAVLSLDACEFDEQAPQPGLPTLEHIGTFLGIQFKYVRGGFVLPSGVQLAVPVGRRVRGRSFSTATGRPQCRSTRGAPRSSSQTPSAPRWRPATVRRERSERDACSNRARRGSRGCRVPRDHRRVLRAGVARREDV